MIKNQLYMKNLKFDIIPYTVPLKRKTVYRSREIYHGDKLSDLIKSLPTGISYDDLVFEIDYGY